MIKPAKRKRGESGNSLFLGTMALVYIIPLMGLSIDASFLYAVKGRLQAAIDGASLGAARALNIGQTLTSQQTNAAQNAVNWFYANFPPNTWATSGTTMATGTPTENDGNGFYSQNVNIYPDPNNAQLDHVDLTASTKVPTWFMHWFGLTSTTLNVKSSATRRAAVIMMVLDRSGSMCWVNGVSKPSPCTKTSTGSACQAMINASKQFTGQFAEGRDYIGLVTFSSGVYVVKNSGGVNGIPDTNFQTTLGYTSTFGSGTGAIDNITCDGYTNTSEAVSLGYNLLYQRQLPGALNILLIETDGLPNSMTLNLFDNTASPKVGLTNSSTCIDSVGNKLSSPTPGFGSSGLIPTWGDNFSLNLQAAPFGTGATPFASSTVPKGMVGVFASDDPNANNKIWALFNPWSSDPAGPQTAQVSTNSYNSWASASAAGCAFKTMYQGSTNPPDLKWFPQTDVFGNQLKPSSNPYMTAGISSDGHNHYLQNGWTGFHSMAVNAVENAAYNARANTTIPAYIFTLGLGGNSTGAPLDPILLQRMANDPNGDEFNTPAQYSACSLEPTCVNYGKPQLQGTFVYSPDSDSLAQAFLRISSQILRLNQ